MQANQSNPGSRTTDSTSSTSLSPRIMGARRRPSAEGGTHRRPRTDQRTHLHGRYRAASDAFEAWGETTPAEHQLAIFRIADAMEARAEEFADLESQDTGKPRATLVADEIVQSVDQLRFFAGAARNFEGRSAGEYLKDHTSFVRREPIGVIGQVTPWNYPLNMAVWKIAPAIAAGNNVVLKPSDTTPQSTLLLAEVAAEFLPAGVCNVVTGDRSTGSELLGHDTPQMVATTGVRCASPSASTSVASGSTRTSHSCRTCPTAGSSTRATARTSPTTASRTTRGSST